MTHLVDNLYDPDLHGDEPVPPPSRGLVALLTIIVVTAPFLAWWLVS